MHKLDAKTRITKAETIINEDGSAHPLLFPLLIEKTPIRSTYGKRKEPHLFESIDPDNLLAYEEDGWVIHKEGQRKVRVKKLKDVQQMLEDQVWVRCGWRRG
jgi:hypothetical protein